MTARFYCKDNLNLDQNLVINLENRKLMTLDLNLEETFASSESKVEVFCFLFRRHKAQHLYTSHLKEMLMGQQKLFNIAIILNKILTNYKIAL